MSACAWALVLAALVLRVAYAFAQRVLRGDAISYVQAAREVAAGNWAAVDPYWFTPYSLLLAGAHAVLPLPWIGLSRLLCIVTGTLTVLLVARAGRHAFGAGAALAAATILTVHPRMLESSADGYTESAYTLLLLAGGLAFLEARRSREVRAWVPLGVLLGALFVMRQESGLLLTAGFAAVILVDVLGEARGTRAAAVRARSARATVSLAFAAGVTLLFVALVDPRVDGPVLFGKAGNLRKTAIEEIGEQQRVAREVYRPGGLAFHMGELSLGESLHRTVRTYPAKLAAMPIAAARAVLHPLLVVLAVVGAVVTVRARNAAGILAVVLVGLPLLAYPAAHLIARYLYQILPWLSLLAGVGLVTVLRWRSRRIWRAAWMLAVFAPLVAGAAYAAHVQGRRGLGYLELAAWMNRERANGEVGATRSEAIVTQAAALPLYARGVSRILLPWLNEPCALAGWMRANGLSRTAVDRRYLERAMPQYLPLVQADDPRGFRVEKDVRAGGEHVRLLRRDGHGCPASARPE